MMLNAYHGNWSWDRRAVIVKSGGRFIAGSMNGMPHADGAIRDNGFNGHSCIHFSGSKVHGRTDLDFAHQLMIKKAGGAFFDTIMEMPPEEILRTFITLSTQEQIHLLDYILQDIDDDISMFTQMQSISLGPISTVIDNENYVKIEVEALYYIKNVRYEEVLEFEFKREPWNLTWKIKFLE